jgi:hypothetical protein
MSDELSKSQAGPVAGERALMRAVLEEAIRCLAGKSAPARKRPTLALEARRWVSASGGQWPFAFDNICEALGFEPDRLRTRLLQDAPDLPAVPARDAGELPRVRRALPSKQEVVQMIREGNALRVVAETFGISIAKASILSGGLASRIKAERDREIRELRRSGWTTRALAKRFGLSTIRIMRICAREDGELSAA